MLYGLIGGLMVLIWSSLLGGAIYEFGKAIKRIRERHARQAH